VQNAVGKLSSSAVFLGPLTQKCGNYLQQGWLLKFILQIFGNNMSSDGKERKKKSTWFKSPWPGWLQTAKHPHCVHPPKQVHAFYSCVLCTVETFDISALVIAV